MASGLLTLQSTLLLTGGAGNAAILPYQLIPQGAQTANCSLLLNGSSLSCNGPLSVQFNVPFTVELTLSASDLGGVAETTYRTWRLETRPGTTGGSFQVLSYGVYQNGVPYLNAQIAEVAVPEPSTGLMLAAAALMGSCLLRRR